MIRRHPLLALGLVAALAVPSASALAAGHGSDNNDRPHAKHTLSCEKHNRNRCQFEGTVISFTGTTLVVRLNGLRDITETLTLVPTSTPTDQATFIQPRGATLTPGEQVHVVALRTGPGIYKALRVIVQRQTPDARETPEANSTPEATEAPGVTRTPEATEAPKASETPEAAKTPEATEVPDDKDGKGHSKHKSHGR